MLSTTIPAEPHLDTTIFTICNEINPIVNISFASILSPINYTDSAISHNMFKPVLPGIFSNTILEFGNWGWIMGNMRDIQFQPNLSRLWASINGVEPVPQHGDGWEDRGSRVGIWGRLVGGSRDGCVPILMDSLSQ